MNIDELLDSAEKILKIANNDDKIKSNQNYAPDLSSGSIYDELDETLSDFDVNEPSPSIDQNSPDVADFLSSLDDDVKVIYKTIHNTPDLKIEIRADDEHHQLIQTTNENILQIDTGFDVDLFLEYAQSQVAKAIEDDATIEASEVEDSNLEPLVNNKKSENSIIEQYQNAKNENQDSMVLFKVGDFYEVLFDDAKILASTLGLTLTSRTSNGVTVPMSGFMDINLDKVLDELSSLKREIVIYDKAVLSSDLESSTYIITRNVPIKEEVIKGSKVQDPLNEIEGKSTPEVIIENAIEENELESLATKLRTEFKPENIIDLNDSNYFQTTDGIALDKYPKAMVKENTNRAKRLDWFVSQLSKLDADKHSDLLSMVEKYKDSPECYNDIETVSLNVIFGNPYGPTPSHRVPTKEEIIAAKEADRKEKHEKLVRQALEKAADKGTIQRNLEELNRAGNIITDVLSASAREKAYEVFNDALKQSASAAIAQSAEVELDNASENESYNESQLTKKVKSASHEIQSLNVTSDDKPSFYAIYKAGKVIATGEADKFPLPLLQSMAEQTDGVLMWSRKPFDLIQTTSVINTENNNSIDQLAKPDAVIQDRFQVEMQKGLKLVKNTDVIQVMESKPNVIENQTCNQSEVSKSHSRSESIGEGLKKKLNSAVTLQIAKITEGNSNLSRPHDVRFYASTTNDNNVLVSMKNHMDKMIFACVTPQGKFTQLKDFSRKNLADFIVNSKVVEIEFDGEKEDDRDSSGISPSAS